MAESKKKPVAKKKAPAKKSVLTSGDAMLSDEQRQAFLDNVVNESAALSRVRKLTMNRSRVEIPRMTLGSRVLKQSLPAGTYIKGEVVKAPVTEYSSVVLSSSKLTLPWTVTEEFLEDNPNKTAAESMVMRLMGTQASNDLEDLMFNGDELSKDGLLRANNGIIKMATNRKKLAYGLRKKPVHESFRTMLRSLPIKYRKDASKLVFFVSPDTYIDYVYEISGKQSGLSNAFLTSLGSKPTYMDSEVVMSPFVPSGTMILTNPDNIIFGIEKDMKFRTSTEGAEAIKKDERFYALHIRCDFAIQNPDALVVGYAAPNITYQVVKKSKWAITAPFTFTYRNLVRKPSHKVARALSRL